MRPPPFFVPVNPNASEVSHRARITPSTTSAHATAPEGHPLDWKSHLNKDRSTCPGSCFGSKKEACDLTASLPVCYSFSRASKVKTMYYIDISDP